MSISPGPRLVSVASALAFVGTVVLWRWMLAQVLAPFWNGVCVVGTMLLVFPTVWLARKLLDRDPTTARAAWITAALHAVLMVLLGVAIIKAIQTGAGWRGAVLPFPRPVATILVYCTGAVAVLTVVNLALRGLGAPVAVALSRRLATDWLYARTRNPMVLATLAWLVAVGLWLESAGFLVWVLILVTPAWLMFVRVYEERELEIRFGQAYRAYRATTPFLWPRLRRPSNTGRAP